MKASDIQQEYGHLKRRDLPENIRLLVDADPELIRWFSEQERLRGFIGLKRYDAAEEAAAGRCRHRVCTRLANESMAPATPAASERPGRWLAWALGAASMLLLGLTLANQLWFAPQNTTPELAVDSPGPLNPLPLPVVTELPTQPTGGAATFVVNTNQSFGLQLNEHAPREEQQRFQFISNPEP